MAEQEQESFVDEEPIAPISINKYDPFQLRETLNDTLVQLLEEKGFVEDNTETNMKIVTGILAVGVAGASQWLMMQEEQQYKLKNTTHIHGICIVLYGLLMAVYYYIDAYMVKDSFFKCQSHSLKGLGGKADRLTFSSVIENYDDKFKF